MRLLFALTLLACLTGTAFAQPEFVLRQSVKRNQVIPAKADWHKERLFDGIGWMLGTASRGDGSVMKGGFSVVHPHHVDAFTMKHTYVLAAFDLNPDGYLLVTIRDPEYHWPDYDFDDNVVDPLELVWYDKGWEEVTATVLGIPQELYVDDFIISPDERYLLAISHPIDEDGTPNLSGHGLVLVDMKFGEFEELLLPEWEGAGAAPASWWPVRMIWTGQGGLVVQAGKELFQYEVRW